MFLGQKHLVYNESRHSELFSINLSKYTFLALCLFVPKTSVVGTTGIQQD